MEPRAAGATSTAWDLIGVQYLGGWCGVFGSVFGDVCIHALVYVAM